MKICVCTCTYKRPKSLGYLIRCFERQTHPDRLMLILDDAGQYHNQTGDRWELMSIPRRFATLGDKRNALAALVPADCDAIAIWDDDDLYLPDALDVASLALSVSEWVRPSQVLHPQSDWTFRRHETGGLYHGGWVYRKDFFWAAGGYTRESGPEDQGWMQKAEALQPRIVDPCVSGYNPSYIYGGRQVSGLPNISCLGCNQVAYDALGHLPAVGTELVVSDPPWFDLDHPIIEETVYPRPF